MKIENIVYLELNLEPRMGVLIEILQDDVSKGENECWFTYSALENISIE